MEKYATIAFAALTAATYLSGYGYLSGYYQYFDIGIWEIGLSIQDVLSHALPTVILSMKKIYAWTILFLTASVSVVFLVKSGHMKRKCYAFCISLTVVFFITYTLIISPQIGETKAKEDLRSLNIVKISDRITNDLPKIFSDPRIDWFHLTTTSDTLFLVGIFQSGSQRWVARIPRNGASASFVYQTQ